MTSLVPLKKSVHIDATRREAMGTLTLLLRTGPIKRKVNFQVLNIKVSLL